jgi:hypothetical protein
LEQPAGLGLGMCKAVVLRVAVPLCAIWALLAGLVWRDLAGAVLHFALGAVLSWLSGLVALVLVVRAPPLSLPVVLGGSIGPLALPMAAMTSATIVAVALHCWFAASPMFWLVALSGCLALEWPLRRLAVSRLCRQMEAHA